MKSSGWVDKTQFSNFGQCSEGNGIGEVSPKADNCPDSDW